MRAARRSGLRAAVESIQQVQASLTGPCSRVLPMAKAARVLAALKRDGWAETRRSGSHRVLNQGRPAADLGLP